MDTSPAVMRLDLDGRWSAEDLGQAMTCLSDLYDLRLFLELVRDDQRDFESFFEEYMHFPIPRHRWKRRWRYWNALGVAPVIGANLPSLDEAHLSTLNIMFDPDERLAVRRISYASPGFTDLAGIGTVVGHVKDFVLAIVQRRDQKRQREQSDERAALENDRLRIENARSFVALARDLGYSDTDIRSLVAHVDKKQDLLVRLVEQHKLLGVSSPETESDKSAGQ